MFLCSPKSNWMWRVKGRDMQKRLELYRHGVFAARMPSWRDFVAGALVLLLLILVGLLRGK